MILKNTQITWKLKDGVVLKYGPSSDISEKKDNSSELLSYARENEIEAKSESQNTVISSPDTANNEAVIDTENSMNSADMSENMTHQEPYVASENENIEEERIPQSYPESINSHLVNVSSASPVVDGVPVSTSAKSVTHGARWQSLPYRLRPKRADVFIDMQSSVDFLSSLIDYLKKCGLDVKEYNDEFRYLPSDLILADASRIIDAGTILVLQRGKRYIWDALLKEFGARLNGK